MKVIAGTLCSFLMCMSNLQAASAGAAAGAGAGVDTKPSGNGPKVIFASQLPPELLAHIQKQMMLEDRAEAVRENVLATATAVGVKYMAPTNRLKRSLSGTELSSYSKDKQDVVQHLINSLGYFTAHGIQAGRVITSGCSAVANYIDRLEEQLAKKDQQLKDLEAKLAAANSNSKAPGAVVQDKKDGK